MKKPIAPHELGFTGHDRNRLAKALNKAEDARLFRRIQAVLLIAQGVPSQMSRRFAAYRELPFTILLSVICKPTKRPAYKIVSVMVRERNSSSQCCLLFSCLSMIWSSSSN